ncbi:o-succinylbenzoate synthase [Planococcaceae bacterium Storch 2/2-2]|nr:o-succinylbenzoate synthase [Planococcaceae bacterium Storch 2/2-2]
MGELMIETVRLRRIVVPLKRPFQTKLQHVQERESIVVEVSDGQQVGYGECVAFTTPWYTEETTNTCWYVMKQKLIPLIYREPFRRKEEVFDRFQSIDGHRMAKAAVEQAIWDLFAKRDGLSMQQLVGGKRQAIPAGVVVTWQTEKELIERVEEAVAKGYTRVKVKVHSEVDVAALRRVVRQFPDIHFFADANGHFTERTMSQLFALDEVGFRLLEQPFKEEEEALYERYVPRLQTPVALDESIHSLADVDRAIEKEIASCIVLKPGRVGGMSESLRIIERCQREGLDCWIGGMIEFGVSKAFNLALASHEGITLPGDFSTSDHFWDRDIVTPPFHLEEGKMLVPSGAGIGVALDEEAVRSYEVNRHDSQRVCPLSWS